jgi:hypothetical protein
MIRVISFLALAASMARGAVTLGQSCYIDSAAAQTSITCNFGDYRNQNGVCSPPSGLSCTPTATTTGSLIGCVCLSTTASSCGFSDSASQTWTNGPSDSTHWFGGMGHRINSASLTSVTATPNVFGAIVLECWELKGDAAGSSTVFDQSAHIDNGFNGGQCTNCAATSGTTSTTTQAYELLVGAYVDTTAEEFILYTGGSGWTHGYTTADDANGFFQFKTVSSTGTYSSPVTYSNVSGGSGGLTGSEVLGMISTFKITAQATGGGSTLTGAVTVSGGVVIQ